MSKQRDATKLNELVVQSRLVALRQHEQGFRWRMLVEAGNKSMLLCMSKITTPKAELDLKD